MPEMILQKAKRELAALRNVLLHRMRFSTGMRQSICEQFHMLYFGSYVNGQTWGNTFWMGVPTHKCPLDLWTYQELIYEVRPDFIVETGTLLGGSALYLASICDLVGCGQVITVDIEDMAAALRRYQGPAVRARPEHPRIHYLLGSSTSPQIVEQVKTMAREEHRVLVVLDSDHTKSHVLEELRIYSQLVSVGSYLIVEDTNVNGHPVLPDFGPGPKEALEEFLTENSDFEVDRRRESHLLTFNPGGFLRRRARFAISLPGST